MTEQPIVGTATMPNTAQQTPAPTADERNAEQQRLNQQVYDFRRTCDPLLYDRVIAFHPHANTSDEAFAVMQADYSRLAAEVSGQQPAAHY
jgi:hypothetical protein